MSVGRLGGSAARRFGLVAVVVVALVGLVPQYLSRTIPDVAFPLWAAGRVLDGATLYVDILEINPPLFIWLDIPIVAVARATGLDPILVFRVAVTWLLLGSVIGVARVMGGSAARRHGGSAVEIVAVVFVLFVLPRLDWGEREHLALALMLPWLAVAVRRLEGREVSRPMALASGLAAGVGIALKPHFVLIWVARELALWKGGRTAGWLDGWSAGRIVGRADTWAPVVVCVAYLISAFVFTPEYFPMVREMAGSYGRLVRASVLETMLGPAPAVALSALVVTVGLRRHLAAEPPSRRAVVRALGWSTAAWSVVALLQVKGFRYHWYPAMALGFLLSCQLALVARRVRIPLSSRLFRAVATAAVVTIIVAASVGALRQAIDPLASDWDTDAHIGYLLHVLGGRVQPGDTLAVLSPHVGSGFPLTMYLGTEWPLRINAIWPAVAEYQEQLESGRSQQIRPLADASLLERRTVDLVVTDLKRAHPGWILMVRPISEPGAPYMARVRMREFLARDDRFAPFLHQYDSLGTVGLYTIWSKQELRQQRLEDPSSSSARSLARGNGVVRLASGATSFGSLFLVVVALEMAWVTSSRARRLTS